MKVIIKCTRWQVSLNKQAPNSSDNKGCVLFEVFYFIFFKLVPIQKCFLQHLSIVRMNTLFQTSEISLISNAFMFKKTVPQ